ncbi:hypothetical protein AB0J38_28365 [Streptomyces sp. NPDC050095]|uniref:hypothetical protein n=1 Tax=unclassified Streptomyces TaxID=2593676 RepID=UPI00341FBF39
MAADIAGPCCLYCKDEDVRVLAIQAGLREKVTVPRWLSEQTAPFREHPPRAIVDCGRCGRISATTVAARWLTDDPI